MGVCERAPGALLEPKPSKIARLDPEEVLTKKLEYGNRMIYAGILSLVSVLGLEDEVFQHAGLPL